MAAQPQMTVERAKLILKETIALFGTPENKQKLIDANEEAMAAPEEQRAMMKMRTLIPVVTAIAGDKLAEYGIPNVMMGVMQIQMMAGADPIVAEGIQLLTQCASGNIPSDDVIAAYAEKLE